MKTVLPDRERPVTPSRIVGLTRPVAAVDEIIEGDQGVVCEGGQAWRQGGIPE